jgi:AcrR family transcriptional regulator
MDIVYMKKATGRGYHHGDLRKTLLAAGLEILDEGGVEAVTIRETARRASVAHSAPANHFRDRRALLTALAVDIMRSLGACLREALAEPGDARARLKRAMQAVLAFALACPHRYRLINRHDALNSDCEELASAGDQIFQLIGGAAEPTESAAISGDAAISKDTCVFAVWSLVHGYVSLRLDGTLIAGADETSGAPRELALIDALIDGLPLRVCE